MSIELALFVLVIYIAVYSIVNRICKCVEACNLARSYNQYLDKIGGENNDKENVEDNTVDHRRV